MAQPPQHPGGWGGGGGGVNYDYIIANIMSLFLLSSDTAEAVGDFRSL